MAIPWVLIAVAVLAIVLAVVYFKRKVKPNYHAVFTLGIVFLILGMGNDDTFMWIAGAVMLIVGIANKDKWKVKKWKDMRKNERIMKGVIIALLLLLLLAGILLMLRP